MMARRRMEPWVGLLRAMRPRQWVKNLLVLLPLLFAVNLVWFPAEPGTLLRHTPALGLLFVAFCALSSAVYIGNDLADRAADRRHPVKRRRPIAAGVVPPWLAGLAAAILAAAGMGAMFAISTAPFWYLPLAGAIYLLANGAYSLRLKRVAPVDVMLVSGGYVLRAVAGALAVGAAPSPWLYAVTAAGALFLVIGRRYAEARLAGEGGSSSRDGSSDGDGSSGDDGGSDGDGGVGQRATLGHYGPPLGGQLLALSAAAALVSYALYAVEAGNLPANNTMLLTVPPVIFGLFRYLYLLNHSEDAESPELLMLRDAPLLASIAVWMVTAGAVLALG